AADCDRLDALHAESSFPTVAWHRFLHRTHISEAVSRRALRGTEYGSAIALDQFRTRLRGLNRRDDRVRRRDRRISGAPIENLAVQRGAKRGGWDLPVRGRGLG